MGGITLSEAEVQRLHAPVRSSDDGFIQVFKDGRWGRLQVINPLKLGTFLVAYLGDDNQIWVRPRKEIA